MPQKDRWVERGEVNDMQIQAHRLVSAEQRPLPHHGGRIVPRFIIIHYTAGGSADSSYDALDRAGLSAHILIKRDGALIQCVDFDSKAFHAGKSFWRGYRSLNSCSIGIEVCNYGWLMRRGDGKFQRVGETPVFEPEEVIVADHKNGRPRDVGWEVYPEAQLVVLKEVCEALLNEYPTIIEIVGHDDISPDRKQDPGPAMPMTSLQRLVDRRNEEIPGRRWEVTARSGLNMRAGPGVEHEVVRVLPFGTPLTVVDEDKTWYPVDLQNDGAVDGFVHSAYLRLS
jgi:N-acetylmuramoyl-L-alanine amidase